MILFRTALTAALFLPAILAAKPPDTTRTKADIEAATRLQVFLDRAEFGPGKLDGHYGEFTRRALELYRKSQGLPPPADTASKTDTPPDVSDLNMASADPVLIQYTISEADTQGVGELPADLSAQAKLKWLPYVNVPEAIAEKFHCDVDFLASLNPGSPLPGWKTGDQITVPNVIPFVLESIKELKPGSEIALQGVNEVENKSEAVDAPPITTSVKIDTAANMLMVYDQDKLIAAYPVTIGSQRTESPVGDWKVRGVARLPDFRYDEKMLKEGERSDDFHLLPPGPNNMVGVVWIALNKKGIGIHGTSEPDSIGRSASHGCIRLANWDVARLALKVRAGVAVSIH